MMMMFLSAHQSSTVGHDVGIAVLSLVIIAVIVVAGVLLFRRFARRRRQLRFFSSVKNPFGSNSGVNFATMMEEPEMDFQPRDRQLQIIGTTPSAS